MKERLEIQLDETLKTKARKKAIQEGFGTLAAWIRHLIIKNL